MKTLKTGIITSLLAITLTTCVGIFSKGKNVPNPDLFADYSTNASTYYNGITATSGKQLAAQLHDLITSTHQTYASYDDNGSNGLQKTTDRYYQNGNPVSGYIYEFYSGAKWSDTWVPKSTGGYNREHCWCQSHSIPTGASKELWGTTGGGADMHHLRPVEKDLNSTRNNHPYGEIVDDRENYKRYPKLSNGSYSSSLGGYMSGSEDIFEPIDEKKGDVARIILYTYLHYNSYTQTQLFGSYGTTNGSENYSSFFASGLLPLTNIISTPAGTEAKALELMLKWNTNDPADDIEQRRNEEVAKIQGNRNPFIDNSGYADAIWGTAVGITSISKTSATINLGETTTISAVSSNGASISWTSGNSSIASVSPSTQSSGSNVTITANAVGSTTITASVTISGTTYSKPCTVNVIRPLSSIAIQTAPTKTSYTAGEFFDPTGLVITRNYTSGSSDTYSYSGHESDFDFSPSLDTPLTSSHVSVTITYQSKSTSQAITVEQSGSTTGHYDLNLATATYNTQTSEEQVTWDFECATMVADKESATAAANNYLGGDANNRTSSRFYKNSKLTFTPKSSYTLTSVVFSCTRTSYASALANSTWTNASASLSGSTVTITPTNGATAFYGTISGTAGATLAVFNYSQAAAVSLSSISLDVSEVNTSFVVNDTFNYTGLVVTAHYSDSNSAVVAPTSVSTPDMTTIGQKTVTVSYTEGGVTKSAQYYITLTADPTLTWTAPIINVFSGTSLTTSTVDGWTVVYNDGEGSESSLDHNDFDIYLDETQLKLPYTWQPEDDGAMLSVSYSELQTNATSVSIVQILRPIYSEVMGDETTKTWNASSGCLGSAISTVGNSATGTLTFDDSSTMLYTRTLEYLASNKKDYVAFSAPYQQFGSSNALNTLELTASNSATVTQVVVTCWAKNGATNVTVKVGGNVFDESKAAPSAAGSLTFTGSASGNIVITMEKATKNAGCAQYIASVAITTAGSSSLVNIANIAGHEDAQRAVVKFAKAFNSALGATQSCTTGLSSAWSTASSAWTTFLSEASALGSTEEAYAKSLIANATAQWTEGTDSDFSYCLERCLATYEKCVTKHGQTAFMSDVRTLSSAPIVSPIALTNFSNSTLIIVLISVLGLSAVGGYFYIRRKKEC